MGKNLKTIEVDLPCLHPIDLKTTRSTHRKAENIELAYAGKFYKDIRNPEKMLDVLNTLNDEKVALKVYGPGCDYLKSNSLLKNKSIMLCGQLPSDKVFESLGNADFLVNLGNTTPNQIPSKVFEYIAMGKPVINFYFNEFDTSLHYLRKYPLCFNFNLNNYSAGDVEQLKKFIHEKKGSRLTFEQATVNLQNELGANVCKHIVDGILGLT
jgi:glycosyltransferase involved in cell wall biosynthesis